MDWWNSEFPLVFGYVRFALRAMACVAGPRQLVWIAAQYARVVFPVVPIEHRPFAMEAIEAAESWSMDPTQENRQACIVANDLAENRWLSISRQYLLNNEYQPAIQSAAAATRGPAFGRAADGVVEAFDHAVSVEFNCVYGRRRTEVSVSVAEDEARRASDDFRKYLGKMTQSIFAPSLLDAR